jgi:hypothetical protein
MKPVPVKVTRTVAPRAQLDGLIEVTFGPPGITVKDDGPLVPPDVVTVTLVGPVVALAAMVKVAVIWVALTTVTLLTVTPALATLTVAPEIKLVPVNVTGKVLPGVPFDGLMELTVGGAGDVTTSVAVTVGGALTPLALNVSVQLWLPTVAPPVFTDAARLAGVNNVPVTLNHAQSAPGETVNVRPELGLVLPTAMLFDAGAVPPV